MVDRAGQAAMILKFTGRVEKILIGFISVLLYVYAFSMFSTMPITAFLVLRVLVKFSQK